MALDNFRTQKIIWDKANRKIFEAIEANSGDSNGRKLVVQVINQETTESLSGTTLSLGWKSRKGAKGLDAFKVVDASKGIFEIYYTTEMLSNIGNIEASLILIDSTSRIESSTFTISVRPSTVDDESVESENSFTSLTEALVKVNDFDARLAQKAEQSALETEKNRISNLVAHAGDTDNNSELLDIRVGYGGKTFNTAGDAVRSVAKEKERILNNDATEIYGDDVFSLNRAYVERGTYSSWSGWYATDYIDVKKGDVVSVTTDVTPNYPIVLFYDIDKNLQKVIKSTTAEGESETVSHTLEQDGYLIAQKSSTDNDSSITINAGKPLYLSSKNISDEAVIQGKADKIDYKSLLPEFEPGGFTNQGVEAENDYMVRTPVIKILPGTKIKWSRKVNRLHIGYATSETPDFGIKGPQWLNEDNYTFEATHSYVRFAIRDSYGQTIEEPLTLDRVKEESSLNIPSHTMYEYDVDLKVNEVNEKVNDLSRFGYTNTFRTPSLNEGGVVSFIDDDGRDGAYDVLYPLFKRLDVPLGLAIVPRWIESGDAYMSENQLVELAEDEKIIEIMNHTYSHKNLGNLSTEEEVHKEIYLAKKWLLNRGFDVDGFVLPYGSDNHAVRKIVQQYHPSCYDFDGIVRVETFSTIRNELISRTRWGVQENRLEMHKGYIDEAISKNGWVVITTHVDNQYYWDENSESDLEELINYIKSKEIRILKPRDAFQIFGNILENDSGFKIQADGKIIGAQ